jgi:multidrug efflux system membrane fusion protein
VATGEFSSVGSARNEQAAAKPAEVEQPKPVLRTVAVLVPPRLQHARAIRVSGQTEADKRATLATRAAGIIAQLPVKKGDTVKEGDLILMLDAEEKTAAVEMAKALLKQREAEFVAAERLAKLGSAAKLTLDNAFSALSMAKSQLQAAEAELTRKEVRAPFAGLVDRVSVELGSSVGDHAEVATILALDPVVGKGEVSERDLRYLQLGDEASVRLVNGETVGGTLRYISRDASAQTRTFPVEIAIPNADLKIPAGMTAEITLLAEPTDAVVLPRSVVTLSTKGDLGIRAVDKDGKVLFFPIDLIDDTQSGLVLAGIPADARVIVAGQDLVAEGDSVTAVDADPAMIKRLAGDTTGGTQ